MNPLQRGVAMDYFLYLIPTYEVFLSLAALDLSFPSACFPCLFFHSVFCFLFLWAGEDQGVQQGARGWKDAVQGIQQPSGGTAGGVHHLSLALHNMQNIFRF